MQNKITRAIILAAGRGSRLGHLTDEMPKCMLQINDKPVIERTIEVFKERDINDIIVVTGYKAEKLQYLKKKYGVKLIFNKDWETSNSILSMFLASRYLNKNLIVIDSDIYINNECIINTEILRSGYSVVKEYRPLEWQFHLKKDDVIKVDRSPDSKSFPILDISYWLKDDIVKIKKLIKENVSKGNINRFWDEVPCFDLVKVLDMTVYKLDVDDAMEFDTKDELIQIWRMVQ